MPATPASRVRDRPRVPVEDLTVLLITHPGGPVCLQLLDALCTQDRFPQRVVVTGLPPDDPEITDALAHPLIAVHGVELVVREPLPGADGEPELWQVVEDARRDLPVEATHWIWVLHDDSIPEPDALANLVDATRRSSGVGVAGPKIVRADDPRRLLAVGNRITRGGRPVDDHLGRELDQGQHDERQDVLGVPLAGMLVRSDVLHRAGGIDKAFGAGVEGLDLSWRSHLAGHRVVVATDAVVRQGAGGMPAPTATTRRRSRQMALARGPLWQVPFRALGILVTSLLLGLGLLLVKRPAQAAEEFTDVGAVLAPGRGTGARWRFRRRRSVRHRDLDGLFAPLSAAWQGTTDSVHATPAQTRRGPVETGPVSADAESMETLPGRFRRLWSWPLTLAVVVGTALAVLRWRELLPALSGRGYGVTGGEVLTTSTGFAGVWHSWADSWSGAGLGAGAAPAPWLLPVSGLTWVVEQLPWVAAERSPAAVTLTWLLFAAIPLSVATAYVAARTGTRNRWVRAVAGVVWAGLAPLSAGVDDGRLGPVLAHVALPLIVAGVVVAGSRRQGALRTSATFGTVLLLALVGLFTPAVLLLGSLAGLAVLAFGPGWGRLRGLVLLALPWLLTGPWLREALGDPRLALGGPGASVASGFGAAEPWQLLLLHPGGALSPTLWWTAPLLLLAVGATLQRGHRGRRAGVLLLGALLGLAAAVAAPLVHLGTVPAGHPDAGEPVIAWPGLFLSVAGACLLLAAVQALAIPLNPARRRAGWRGPLVTVLATVVAVAGTGALAWTAWSGVGPQLEVAERPYPAVVDAQAHGPDAVRILDLAVTDETVTYRLQGSEPGLWVRDHVGELVAADDETSAPGRQALGAAVVSLVGSAGADEAGTPHEALVGLAVGYVGLTAPPEDPLVAALDATASLTRVSSGGDLLLWRVGSTGSEDNLVPPARVRTIGDGGDALEVVPVAGAHAVTGGPATLSPDASTLVVSQEAGWAAAAEVRVDGSRLDPVEGQWPLSYLLPGGAEQVEIEVPLQHRPWHVAVAVLAGLVAFLALPFGSRRRRIR